AMVTRAVPPFLLGGGGPAVARGVNVVGLRRAGMPPGDRRVIQDASRILYRSGLTPQGAVERIRRELPPIPPLTLLLEFIAGARRGVCGAPSREPGDVPAAPESEPV